MRDKELIQNIKAGDQNAFHLLYAEHADTVYSICFRFCGSRQEAEDLCQDIFFKIYTSIRTFGHRSKLSTWIYRVAVNRCLNHLRDTKKSREQISIGSEENSAFQHQHSAASGQQPLSPDTLLEKREMESIVRRGVDTLPESQKTVLVLQKYEGFSCREIADILGCTLLSVQSRLHRAKKNLYNYLLPYVNDL